MKSFEDHPNLWVQYRRRVAGGSVPVKDPGEAEFVTVQVKSRAVVRGLEFELPAQKHAFEDTVGMLGQAFEHGREAAKADIRAAVGIFL